MKAIKAITYTGGVMQYMGTETGRLTGNYIHSIADHQALPAEVPRRQGNVRVSFKNNSGTAELVQEDHFYPFGLTMGQSYVSGQENKHLYSAKEWNDQSGEAWYDFGFRNYDAALGRWFNVDPLAETMGTVSPYNYCFNDPINYVDPLGLEPRMNIEDFIIAALNSRYGGSWSNGRAHFFTSSEEGLFAGIAYNNYHNSWGNTEYGSAAESFIAFGIIRESGEAPTTNQVKDVLNPTRLNTFASSSDSHMDTPWYVWAWKAYLIYLRETPFLGTMTNPFFKAEAMYVDGGVSFVGAEKDVGYFFIMTGIELGYIVPFSEVAGGGATDAGLGVELGRIDITGNTDKFNSRYLFGVRDKVWLSVSPAGELLSVGGAFSWSNVNGTMVYASSIQIGIGVSPFPFISGGYNRGKIKRKK